MKTVPGKFGATMAPDSNKDGLECAQHLPAPVPAGVSSSTSVGF